MIKKIKSNLLTYLFKDWIKDEWDLETLMLTKSMISQREVELKTMIDEANRITIKGFGHG